MRCSGTPSQLSCPLRPYSSDQSCSSSARSPSSQSLGHWWCSSQWRRYRENDVKCIKPLPLLVLVVVGFNTLTPPRWWPHSWGCCPRSGCAVSLSNCCPAPYSSATSCRKCTYYRRQRTASSASTWLSYWERSAAVPDPPWEADRIHCRTAIPKHRKSIENPVAFFGVE